MDKQRVAVIGPGSWGTALSQVLNDNGHEVRIWGNIAEQINEINDEHTNKRYFKDIVLDEKIKAYHDLEETLKDADAVLFVVPTKVTRLVAKQVAQALHILAPQQATVLVNQLPTLQYLQRQTQPYQIKVHQLQKLQALKYRLLNYKQQLLTSLQKNNRHKL